MCIFCRYDYNSGSWRYDEERVFNARLLREEYPFECSYQCDVCSGGDIRDPFWNEFESEYGDCPPCKYPRNILILGDFFDVNNIPQENRCSKRDLKDWTLL